MLARFGAKAVLLAIGLGMAFFGVGLLGLALGTSLIERFGPAGAYAIAGGVLLLPPLFWAVARLAFRPAKPKTPPPGLLAGLIATLARDTPWVAVLGAGITGLAEMFLSRNRPKK